MNTSDNDTPLIFEYKVEELTKDNPKQTVELLVTLLQSSNQRERVYALHKIDELFDDENAHSTYRYDVYEQISADQRIIDSLLPLLVDADSKTRQMAVIILCQYDKEYLIPYLVGALEDESPAVRSSALRGLVDSAFVWPRAGAAVVQLLSDEDPFIRDYAAQAMSKFNIVDIDTNVEGSN